MLKVIVELWPFGNESKKRTVASMNLWNDGKGTKECGSYEGALCTDPSPWNKDSTNVGTEVKEHLRSASVWTLLKKAIENAGY